MKQATHLLKHLCGEYTKLSWLLEFRRHLEARQRDQDFWNAARAIAATTQNGDLAMAVALWLSDNLLGPLRAESIECWAADGLPAGVRAWLALYGERVLFSDATATKYYALLQKQVASSPSAARSARSIFFPLHVPYRIMQPVANESMQDRRLRYSVEARNFFTRLRFHVVEGGRLAIERVRWRRATAKMQLAGTDEQTSRPGSPLLQG